MYDGFDVLAFIARKSLALIGNRLVASPPTISPLRGDSDGAMPTWGIRPRWRHWTPAFSAASARSRMISALVSGDKAPRVWWYFGRVTAIVENDDLAGTRQFPRVRIERVALGNASAAQVPWCISDAMVISLSAQPQANAGNASAACTAAERLAFAWMPPVGVIPGLIKPFERVRPFRRAPAG